MSYRLALATALLTILAGSVFPAANKQSVRAVRIGDVPTKDIHLAPSLATADTCFVSDNAEITTRIDGWVVGFELYKSLMDPASSCTNPYPFTITAINMPMIFDAPTPLVIAADVEAIDSTTVPGCKIPGTVLTTTAEWTTQVPSAGIYNIWVPLDEPLVVNGPFFAGFYLGNAIDPAVNAAVLCDEVPVPCVTFNIWDESIGWIDLVNNSYYNFPGRLAMEVAGVPGGSSGLNPELELLSPADGDKLYGQQELWAWDKAASGEVQYVVYEYSNGGPFIEIGRDFDGSSPLRDGLNPVVGGGGFSLVWDFAFLAEGTYDLRTTLVDNQGASYSTTISVFLEPTPPLVNIIDPGSGSAFCTPVDISMTTPDENLSFIQIFQHEAVADYTLGLTPVSQQTLGDANGDPADGNHVANNEFGDYYSGPLAAAMAARLWYDRGVTGLMMNGAIVRPFSDVAEELAALFMTRAYLGTYDENLIAGLRTYVTNHGGGFDIETKRSPTYSDLRIWAEDEERAVILGLGGNLGIWLAVDGFGGWPLETGSSPVKVINPLNGIVQTITWQDQPGQSQMNFSGPWQPVEIMISLIPSNWSVARAPIGVDFDGSDGWAYTWGPSGLEDGGHHYIRVATTDANGNEGWGVVLSEYNCASVYIPGDYDNDKVTTMADLFALVQFIARQGPEPWGGAARADANCDNQINIADVIYYMNFLYGTASSPCR